MSGLWLECLVLVQFQNDEGEDEKGMTTQSLKEDGRPADQWYWDDWFSSFDVRLCSLAARGLWIDMLGIMFKAEIRGTLTINGKQIDGKILAKIVRDTEQNINTYIRELEDNKVFSRLEDGTIINRRMFNKSKRKEEISQVRSEAGKKGAEVRWQSDDNKNDKNITKEKAKMATSSSTPSSTSKDKNHKNDSSRPKYKYSDDHFAIANLLKDAIEIRVPKYKLKGKDYLERWANEVRLMEENREATLIELRRIISWIFNESDFWFRNILSMEKLREKFGQLWANMEGSRPKRDVVGLSTKKPTKEQDVRYEEAKKKRIELEEKYRPEIEKARKDGDMKAIGGIGKKINNEMAEWSRKTERKT